MFSKHRERVSQCECGNELMYVSDRINRVGRYRVREYCDKCRRSRWFGYVPYWVKQRRKEYLAMEGWIR